MRLTKKNGTPEGTTIGMPIAVSCYWKLKEYEDEEDDLDEINLLTLINALRNGIWVSSKERFDTFIKGCELRVKGKAFVVENKKYHFKDFGKTWLTDMRDKWSKK